MQLLMDSVATAYKAEGMRESHAAVAALETGLAKVLDFVWTVPVLVLIE